MCLRPPPGVRAGQGSGAPPGIDFCPDGVFRRGGCAIPGHVKQHVTKGQPMTPSERGALLREKRERAGLSLYRTAVLAKVHPNTVHLAEKGATSPAMLDKIESALEAGKIGN